MIGVANTLDLPERLLPRIASRLGSRRVTFQPYTRQQLVDIITQRLKDADALGAFDANSITFAARKASLVWLASCMQRSKAVLRLSRLGMSCRLIVRVCSL